VVIEPTDAVDLAGEHVRRGIHTGRLIGQRDIEALVLVVAQSLGEHEW